MPKITDTLEFDEDEYTAVIDPRDDVLSTFHYWHPEAIPHEAQYNGVLGHQSGIEQLILIELLDLEFVCELQDRGMALTQKGLEFVENRLDKWPTWSDYCVKPNAPGLPPTGKRLLDALRGEDFRKETSRYSTFLDCEDNAQKN